MLPEPHATSDAAKVAKFWKYEVKNALEGQKIDLTSAGRLNFIEKKA
jgi:hypothetical protein